jgi:hypothetical protein
MIATVCFKRTQKLICFNGYYSISLRSKPLRCDMSTTKLFKTGFRLLLFSNLSLASVSKKHGLKPKCHSIVRKKQNLAQKLFFSVDVLQNGCLKRSTVCPADSPSNWVQVELSCPTVNGKNMECALQSAGTGAVKV